MTPTDAPANTIPAWAPRTALLLGVLLSVLLAAYIARWERQAWYSELQDLAKERVQLLHSTLRQSMEVLHSLGALYESRGTMAAADFQVFAREALQRHPELQALEWIPRVPDAQRTDFEQRMRQQGFANFVFTERRTDSAGQVLMPAEVRAEYFPVYHLEPYAGNQLAHGFDLASSAPRMAALRRAWVQGQPAASAPLRLAQEPGNQQGFLMFYPLYQPPRPLPAQREAALTGFSLAVFRSGDLVRTALEGLAARGIDIALYDDAADKGTAFFQAHGERHAVSAWQRALFGRFADLEWAVPLDVAGRPWRLVFHIDGASAGARLPWQALGVLLAGLVMTASLAGFLGASARRTREVAQANAALQVEVEQRARAVEAAEAANRAKTDFLASMSHEIRTPMNAVLGYAQLLRQDHRMHPDQRESINAIIISGNHLLNQIDEVLDFSKVETGRMERYLAPFELNGLLQELATMFQPRCQEKRLQLRVEALGDAPCWVLGDAGKLRQILINLLGNAVRFTQRGEVLLGLRETASQQYRFEVIDTGPGISSSEQATLFEPFRQGTQGRLQGGTGLGLAIAARMARFLGGNIELFSEPGMGSRFSVNLPLPACEAAPTGDAAVHRWQLLPGQRLLVQIVDDLFANRDVLTRLLRQAGCDVLEADSAAATFQQLEQVRPDICFLDIRMPHRGGLELIRELRQHSNAPRCVIAYSASALAEEQRQCLDAGCDAFLAKPFRVERIFQLLQQHLDVRFTREVMLETESRPPRPLDYRQILLPEPLLTRLLTATELHSTTVLKAQLEELRNLSGEAALLAEHLWPLVRAYDMDAIARILLQVAAEEVIAPESSL